MDTFDVIVIGSGPGGYVCAIRCAQLGMKTALVEKYPTLGGTCLNVGCIPSKAWLDSSEKYADLVHHFQDHGIRADGITLDFGKMRQRVEKVVKEVGGGVNFLMKKNKITLHQGLASFKDPHTLKIAGKENREISGKYLVIATGSKPSTLPGVTLDKKRIISSTEALYLDQLPKTLLVVGGGVIGCELACVFNRLGTKVTIVEYADNLLVTMDRDIGLGLGKIFKKQGIDFHLNHAVSSVQVPDQKGPVIVVSSGVKTKESLELSADLCLVATGRRPYTEGLDLEKAGIKVNDRGRVVTGKDLRTSCPHIFAIGDVAPGPMLAHKASEEGVFVAELLAGQKPHLDYNLIPSVVYTHPEAASLGATEGQLLERNVAYSVGTFPIKALGRARASGESEGFVKVLASVPQDEILGVHMLGPRASDMIAEALTAMEFRASCEDVARSCHAHPTYSEALMEACLAACGSGALHL